MPGAGFPILGTWSVPKQLGTTTTPYAILVPPFSGQGPARQTTTNRRGITHVKKVCVTAPASSVAVAVYTIMRPLNWAVITSSHLKNTTPTLVLDQDPCAYSTSYRYACDNGGVPCSVANNTYTTGGDYVAFQLADGTWWLDKTVSGAYTASLLTTALPNPTGVGGITAGTILYFFGIVSDKDPATGSTGYSTDLPGIASAITRDVTWADEFGIAQAIHPGDPLLIYSDGASSASTVEFASGYYADF